MARRTDTIKRLAFAGAVLGAIAHARGADLGWTLAIAVAGPAVVIVAYKFLTAFLKALVGAARSSPSHAAYLSAGDAFRAGWGRPVDVDLMSGQQFEDHVAQVIRSCGLPVIMTAVTGDWGVDLIVGHRPDRVAIQCKRNSRPVGAGAVQQVVAGAAMQDCTRTMVVTNQEFTPAARRLATVHDCQLVSGSELRLLGRRIRLITGRAETA